MNLFIAASRFSQNSLFNVSIIPPVFLILCKYKGFLRKSQRIISFFSKTHQSSLNLKRSSKTHQSSLTLKGGSTSHLGLLPSGKKRKPLLLNSLYDPFGSPCRGQKRRSEPFHSKVGGPSEVFASSGAAVFCAGINPLSLKDLLRGCLQL